MRTSSEGGGKRASLVLSVCLFNDFADSVAVVQVSCSFQVSPARPVIVLTNNGVAASVFHQEKDGGT